MTHFLFISDQDIYWEIAFSKEITHFLFMSDQEIYWEIAFLKSLFLFLDFSWVYRGSKFANGQR